jgi:2-dehydropantoate 2-reductase
MRIAIIGAGAIGGFIAAMLARRGVSTAVVARGAHLDAIKRSGLSLVHSDFGSFTVNVDASGDLRELAPVDVVILAFKAHQFPVSLAQFEPAVAHGATFVTLQNGVPFWFRRTPPLTTVDPGGRLAALFPDRQLVGGVVHVSGHVVEPGVIHQSGGTRYVLGALDPAARPVLERLADVLRDAQLTPDVEPDVRHYTWLKLVNNTGYNPLSATTGMTIHEMIRDAVTRAELYALMSETVAVGKRLGVIGDVDIDARMRASLEKDDVRTSMLQDLAARRPLELDPIVGAVVELGEDLGVPVPHLRAIYDELRERTAAYS